MNLLVAVATMLALQAPVGGVAVADIEDVSLAALLDTDVSVTSSTAATARASPGVVTVWTRDEIRALGVRDLGELLPFIAGFDLGIDTVGLVGAAFRGNWGFEGKVLFLVDGIELNETAFGSMPLFARVPLEDVERIEVLRGPGSANYGGFAGLAVVSITTRSHTPADRFALETTMGATGTDVPPRNGTAAIAGGVTLPSLRRFAGDVDVAGFASVTTRAQSARDYASPSGVTLDQTARSDALNLWMQSTLRAPFFEGRVLLQNWQQQNQTGYDAETFATVGPTQFLTGVVDLRAPLPVTPTLTLLPRLTWSRFLPWRSPVHDPDYRVVNDRLRLGTTTRWRALPNLSLAGGLELTGDVGRHPVGPDVAADVLVVDWDTGRADAPDVAFTNVALFGEASVDTPLFQLTVGARGERHSAYGDSFVPRVALTRVFPGAHAKLLVAGAFRAPAIDNLRATPTLQPESTATLGLEAGLALTPALYLTVDVFDIAIRDPIVYFVDESGADEDGYGNFGHTGSRGIETTLLGTAPWGRLQLSWSYASTAGKNDVDIYATPTADDRLLGLPSHKAVAVGSLFLSRLLTLTGHAVLRSERAAVVGLDDAGFVVADLPPSAMLGGTLRMALADSGITLLIGVRNLLGEDFRLAQPYASGHGPLPIDDREVFLRFAGALDGVD
jgi:outer membrane cobalamin receptor